MTVFHRTASDRANNAQFCLRSGYPVWIKSQYSTQTYCVFAIEHANERQLAYLKSLNCPLKMVLRVWKDDVKTQQFNNWQIMQFSLCSKTSPADLAACIDPSQPCNNILPCDINTVADTQKADLEAVLKLCRRFQMMPAIVVAECNDVKGDTYDHVVRMDDINHLLDAPVELSHVSSARVPVNGYANAQLHVFRLHDTQEEHYALVCESDKIPESGSVLPLVRLHSTCMTGDVFGSLKCDCGPQLDAALAQITQSGSGALLYLMQEGRGIGLANKMRAYALQEQGIDTVDANHALGFEDDERDFRIGAEILKALGLTNINLLTNNPRKVNVLSKQGITVSERIPLVTQTNTHNVDYLATKSRKSGHIL